jgi:hypothetical protein
MDVASLVRDGPVVRAWLRVIYARPQDGADGAKFLAMRSRQLFDCKNRRSAMRQMTTFAHPDFVKVVYAGSDAPDALLEWSDVAPDSVGERMLEFACSKAPM